MTIDTLLFDLDDTLLEYEQRSCDVLAASFDRVDVEPFFDVSEYHARYDEFLEAGLSVDEQRGAKRLDASGETASEPTVSRRLRGRAATTRKRDARLRPRSPTFETSHAFGISPVRPRRSKRSPESTG